MGILFPKPVDTGPGIEDVDPGWRVHEDYGIPVAECPETFQTKYLTRLVFDRFKEGWLAFVKSRYPDQEIRNDYGDCFNPFVEYQAQYPMKTNDRLKDLTMNVTV